MEIVEAARRMGIYTIVTDNHIDWKDAPAKKVADEAWDISWSNIVELEKKCIDARVDGVIAGFSERRVNNALLLSQKLQKPFYAEGANTQKIFDKIKFKEACMKAGVAVPRQFSTDEEVIFPVIVKPSDNGGSKGISICYNSDELRIGVGKALSSSDSKNVLIEEYLTCDEIMVYFTVHDGEATLSAMCDRYMHSFDPNITQLPIGYYYPSKYLNIFKQYNLDRYRALIRELGIRDGLIAFQAFVKDKDVIPFDPTFRLDGTMAYHMIEKKNGINVLKCLIEKSIIGTMGDKEQIEEKERPDFVTPSFELPILLGKGVISEVFGLESIKCMEDVVHVYISHAVGDVMEKNADFSQIFCRIHICADSERALIQDIKQVFDVIDVLDDKGNSMVINKNFFVIGE